MNLTQLPLEFNLRDDATFANYHPGNNKIVCDSLVQMIQGKGEKFIYLWGDEYVGKTHLLQATCHLAAKAKISAVYLPLEVFISTPITQQFNGLENVSLVCLDNIQVAAQNLQLEETLFHLFNRLMMQQNSLLVTAIKPPMQLNLSLEDLKSRLSGGVVYQLQSLDDAQKLLILQLRAKSRGLELDDIVGGFLLRRYSRSMIDLFMALDSLDKASLVKQHKLTIPFVKQVLEL